MQRSTTRFLTTHTGSLPRPDDLIRMMYAKEEGVPVDAAALAARVRTAVSEVVKKQAEAGVDLINDGEMSKPSYATYVKDRLNGFGGSGNTFVYQDSKSNFIEHRELIAQRIARYATLVGRENVIAGSDCGFGTWVGQAAVDPDVVFAKLAAMAEGARIASKQFWK
jgi:methionine synthase II (cobalamin-independent)